MEDEQDPQDTAVLSDEMAEPKPEQRKIHVDSVYSGLVEVAKTHGKLYRTNGRHADMVKFDLTAHSAFVGHVFIIGNGEVKVPTLETATVKVDIAGLPWLTEYEQGLDPVDLFREHYLSRPNGAERYMASNFPAKDVDEMTDDEIAQGMPRGEARVRLEAWILCAALDGTLEKYVTSQANWIPDSWWWAPAAATNADADRQLVIKTDWWRRAVLPLPGLKTIGPEQVVVAADGGVRARIPSGVCASDARAMQVAPNLARLAKSLAQEAFKLQMRAKCYDLDPTICEINRLVEYIDTGRVRNAQPDTGNSKKSQTNK